MFPTVSIYGAKATDKIRTAFRQPERRDNQTIISPNVSFVVVGLRFCISNPILIIRLVMFFLDALRSLIDDEFSYLITCIN